MATIAEALKVAEQYQQAGHLREAEDIYRQIIQADPYHVEARRRLETIQSGARQPSAAAQQEALAVNRQGIALFHQGRLADSLDHFLRAIQLWPDFPDAHCNAGNVLYYQGKYDDAVRFYQQSLQLRPDDAGVHSNLGNCLFYQGKYDEAVAVCRHAVRLAPEDGGAYSNLGNALKGQGNLDEAIWCYRQAARLKPDFAEARNNLGLALVEQGNIEEALKCYQEAIRLKPDYADAYNHLGLALAERWRLEEAIACYDRALQLDPNHARACFAKGVSLYEQGKPAEAIACYERALHLKPDLADARWGRGLAQLLLGNYTEGWLDYEWRWQCKPFTPRPFPRPMWDGAPLEGKTVLLHAEQGLGDTMQFIRFAPLVKARGGRILLECQESLIPLLSRCSEIDQIVPQCTPQHFFDVHAPLLSLPRILGITAAHLPGKIPYLYADPLLIENWRQKIAESEEQRGGRRDKTASGLPLAACRSPLKIGIAWHGNPRVRSNLKRSIPLLHFVPLAQLEGVRLFSLQKGPGFEQLAELQDRFPIVDLGSRLETYADTAAVLMNLDLVISMDTSLVHCAGALGRPVWVVLSSTPEWRWLLDREDSPWYPTARLFRQKQAGDWEEVFARIAQELKSWRKV